MKPVAIITGGAGFIGQYLVEEFSQTHDLICLIRPASLSLPRIYELIGINEKSDWVYEHDILYQKHNFNSSQITLISQDIITPINIDNISKICNIDNVDIVLHAGGNPSSESSINDPTSIVYDNVVGTVNMLDLSNILKINRFVYYGAAESYGPVDEGSDSKEDDPYNSISPYAASKASGAEFSIAYSKTFGLPVSIINIANTFGPRCQSNRFPVIAIRNILAQSNTTIAKSSSGKISGRRWFHAQDVADITRFVISNQNQLVDKWNAAGDNFIDNASFGLEIANILNMPFPYTFGTITRNGHDAHMSISPQKLYDAGWKPKFTLKERLEDTISWYVNNKHWLK